MAIQIPLNIKPRDDATFENFIAGDNQQLLHSLTCLQEPYLFLYGSSGSGKTHLLQAVSHAVSSNDRSAVYLPLAQAELEPQMLEGLEQVSVILLDDIQSVARDIEWEQAIFNLYNRVKETGAHLIVASELPIQSLDLNLADLHSRLTWGPVFQLKTLSDKDKKAVLQLRANKRGLVLTDEVANYLLKRIPRDMGSLLGVLDKLDKASMVEKRKLTIPFIKSYL